MKDLNPNYVRRLYQVAIILGGCGAFYLFYYFILPALKEIFDFLLPIIAPFVLGGLLAALMEPLVGYLEKSLRLKRGLAAFLTLVLIVSVFFTVISLVISRLSVEVVKLSKELPRYTDILFSYFKDYFDELKSFYQAFEVTPELLESLSQNVSGLLSSLTNLTSGATNFFVSTASILPDIVIILIISLMATFFFSRDRQVIANIAARILPNSWYRVTQAVGEDMGKAIFGYIRAQLTLVLVTMAQTIIGLYLMGIDYAIIMGIVVGIVDILPVLGSGSVLIPWLIFELFTGDFSLAIGLGVLYAFIVVVRQVLEPKVVADNLGIHPLATLISIYVGYKLFGFIGLILGPFLLVVIKAASRANIFSRWI